MKAKEAEQKAKESLLIYRDKLKREAIERFYQKIKEATDKGYGSITGGWDFYNDGMVLVLDQLKSDGYYVRYKYNGASMDCIIAWSEEKISEYKTDDEILLMMEENCTVIDKKWWQIF